MNYSTLSSWALVIWKTLQDLGLEPQEVFGRAGLNPEKAGSGPSRYDFDSMQNLWRNSLIITDRQDFGVLVGQRWHPSTFYALGFAWLASHSLREGLMRMSRYSMVISDSLSVASTKQGHDYCVSFTKAQPELDFEPVSLAAAIACLLKMCRQLYGETFTPNKIVLNVPIDKSLVALADLVSCPVEFVGAKDDSQPLMCVYIADSLVEKRLLTGSRSLVEVNDRLTQTYLANFTQESFAEVVAKKIVGQLPGGTLTEISLAQQLNMSSRTLQRKLSEEQTSFSSMLTEIRRRKSISYLESTNLSFSEVAFLLGFSEQSNFSRAFRKWHGMSPSDFKKSLRQKVA